MAELFLGNEKVLTLDEREHSPGTLYRVDNPELLPIALKNECTNEKFLQWFEHRKMPANRDGLAEVKALYGDKWFGNKNFASLSDHYWLRMRTETYAKTNFFHNSYHPLLGDMFFEPWTVVLKTPVSRTSSPDLTTGGRLRKRWKQKTDGSSFLVKACGITTYQEPLSEVLVSVLLNRLDMKSANYSLCVDGMNICCQCDNFVSDNINLVTAEELLAYQPISECSLYDHLLSICEQLDIPNAEEYLDSIIFIDYLTLNFDRKPSDIGFLYNYAEQRFIGPAPIYDCAAAYWSGGEFISNMKQYIFHEQKESVLKKMKDKIDLTPILTDYYSNLILKYPAITEQNRERMIQEIEEMNKIFCQSKESREEREEYER